METITLTQLRRATRHYINRVTSGESFIVTRRGIPHAILEPPPAERLRAFDAESQDKGPAE